MTEGLFSEKWFAERTGGVNVSRMMMKTYNTALVPRARSMRREMTPAEKYLWLNCLKLLPHKFRRQRPFGRFIVDFYCAELKLVIEVDGDSHFTEQGMAYDAERTRFLESLGLRVVRFTNAEVFTMTPSAVMEQVPPPPRCAGLPLLRRGRHKPSPMK